MSDNLPNDFQGSIAPTTWVSSGEPDSAIVSGIAAAVLACQQAAAQATAAAASAAEILAAIQAGNFPGGGGTDPTPSATTSIQGKVKLAGDLGGTADLPTVPGVVKDTGDLVIGGNKSFSLPLTIVNGTTAQHAVSKTQFETAAVLKAGNQTITGILTFSADPVFNNSAIPQVKVANLVTDLSTKALATDLTALTAVVATLSDSIDSVGLAQSNLEAAFTDLSADVLAGSDGNVHMIDATASPATPRVNQTTGQPLQANTHVLWISPVDVDNDVSGDITASAYVF